MIRFCDVCNEETTQHTEKYNPELPIEHNAFLIWVCDECGEKLDIVSNRIIDDNGYNYDQL